MMPLEYFVITVLSFCFTADTEAINCNPIQRRAEDNVTLPCFYKPRSDQNEYLDIEWAIRNNNDSYKLILTLSGGKVYVTCGWEQRISFASANGTAGDASLYFKSLDVNDSGLYNCKVKIRGKIEQAACKLIVQAQDGQNYPTQYPITDIFKTEQQTMNTTSSNNTSSNTDPSSSSNQILPYGIPFGILGFIMLVILSVNVLTYKTHSSQTSVNNVQQSEDFEAQGHLTAQIPDENTIYSVIQSTRPDTVNPTAQARDQDIIYSKVQKLNTVQYYNGNFPRTPKQNLNAAPLSDTAIHGNADIVYAKLKS